jgi:hypothetical protein
MLYTEGKLRAEHQLLRRVARSKVHAARLPFEFLKNLFTPSLFTAHR